MTVWDWFDNRSETFIILLVFLLVAGVGLADYSTGNRMAFSIFYLIPIYLVTSKVGRQAGLIISFASAIAWFLADFTAWESYAHLIIPFWNAGVRLGFFFIIVLVLSRKDVALTTEKVLARTDPLTGMRNRRAFFELLSKEIARSRRFIHTFSLAYIDCDNFKAINDQSGHETGDALLCRVALTIQDNMRTMDTAARLGGDEFAILMPETLEESAFKATDRLRERLLDVMQQNDWPVTFSIGLATFKTPVGSADEAVKRADNFMYTAKNKGKNSIVHGSVGIKEDGNSVLSI